MPEPSDIAIVGGGLVGLCAALIMQHPSRQVTVLEAGKPGSENAGGLNTRSIALASSSVQIFRALDLWSDLEPCAAPITEIHISARERWGVTRLHARDYDLDALGYVIENHVLNNCLLEAVTESKRIKLVDEAEFDSITQTDQIAIGYRRKRRQHQLSARFGLIGDGAHSRARDALGIGHQRVDYGQVVIVCTVEVSAARIETAYERFTTRGPLAMLPLGENRYACVWTLDPVMANTVAAYEDDAFRSALQDCFGFRLGFIEQVGKRFALPIERIQAERLYQGRCLLIGNAANALHPVAGQSFNLSLRDLAGLYELLANVSLQNLDDVGIEALLIAYAAAREAEQRRVIRYGDSLVSLFSNRFPMLAQVRAAGLSLLDILPALKTQVAYAGMGLAYGGNRLLRGHL